VGKGNSNILELARVILQGCFSHLPILKVAHSAYYMLPEKGLSLRYRDNIIQSPQAGLSYSDSILFRAYAQAKIVIEALLRGNQRQRLITEMASSFSCRCPGSVGGQLIEKIKAPEEVFYATLLYHLGNMVSSSFAEETLVKKLEAAMQEPVCTTGKREMEI